MADIVDELADLHRQATHEPSHYYAAKTAERAIREIERLRATIKHIGEVCDDNAAASCNQAMALAFVRSIVRDHEQNVREKMKNDNIDILARLRGVAAKQGTPESDSDPRNPNVNLRSDIEGRPGQDIPPKEPPPNFREMRGILKPQS